MSDAGSFRDQKVRDAKRALRDARRSLTLPEKVAQVIELQRIVLPMIRRRRPLRPWEKVWDIRDSEPNPTGKK